MTRTIRVTCATVLLASGLAAPLRGDETADTIADLKRQIQELDQKVRVLERRMELDKEAAAEKSRSTPVITAGPGGFSLSSADTNFLLKVRGYVQADARFYFGDNIRVNDTFLLRRVRPILEGTVFRDFDYRLMLDFGSGVTASAANDAYVQDAYLNWHRYSQFQIQAGKFKEPVGLERLQSGANLLFVERSYPTQLVPNRDVGVQVQGDLFGGRLRYEAGVFNGVADGGSGDVETSDDERDLAARLFATPFKNSDVSAWRGLGFGVSGTIGDHGGALRNYVTPGQQRFFSYLSGAGTDTAPNVSAEGRQWRLVPQGYYYWGPFGLFGEYAISSQEVRRVAGSSVMDGRIRNDAWEVSVSYILTGEDNSWRALNPRRPVGPAGGWGAWELTARVEQLNVDDDAFPMFATAASASEAFSWGLGLNWHLNRNVKLNLDYHNTRFSGGSQASGQVTAQDEHVILTRAQVSF